jgi:DNA repair protein RecN (Recombination protein N)
MKIPDMLYLKSLRLQNFATFENQIINFEAGFNAIVGETGSGKSLILDALQIIFGSRADKKLVRKNAEFSTVEATFYSDDISIKKYFDEIGHPFDGTEIVVKRIIYSNENSKSFLNFQACSASLLAHFSKRFIDLVGQFENQKLLSEDYQLILVDSYAGLSSRLYAFRNNYSALVSLRENQKELLLEKHNRSQREDYIRFQIEELHKLNPSIDDEKSLINRKDFLLNFEKRQSLINSLSALISEDDISVLNLLKSCLTRADKSPGILSEEIMAKLYDAKFLLEDVSFDLSKVLDCEAVDENLDYVIDRLDTYQRLKRKFGGSTDSMLEKLHEFQNELNSFINIDERLDILSNKIMSLETQCMALSESLHTERIAAAANLSFELTSKIRELKMNGASIKIEASKNSLLNSNGISKIEFFAETNPGEGYFKIREIASGGELSRILLSVRQILSSSDTISVFLFDEIDSGIGGETALCIGRSLKEVSASSQVLAITHLPQIASCAAHIISVSKSTSTIGETQRTISLADEITVENRQELLRSMSPIV